VRLGELAIDNEARAIKGRSGKLGKRAGKVNVLTRGDLLSGYQNNPDRERCQVEAAGVSRGQSTTAEVGRAEHQEDE